MARYDSSWDSHKKLMITIPIVSDPSVLENGTCAVHPRSKCVTGLGVQCIGRERRRRAGLSRVHYGKLLGTCQAKHSLWGPSTLQGFGFDSTPLTRKLFEAFDADNSGKINLVEVSPQSLHTTTQRPLARPAHSPIPLGQFVAGLRNWKMFTYEEKMKFTYKIYDLDGSGFVEPHELAECLADSNAGWRDKGAMQQIVRKILKYLEMADLNRVKLSDFTTLAKKFPSSLFLPLFGLMEKIFTVVEIHDDEASMPSVM